MEGASNGGMLYHEVQESKLCAVHCVNTVLQGPFFSEFDLAALASDLDRKERQMMMLELEGGGGGGGGGAAGGGGGGGGGGVASGDFLSVESHNVSLDGDFSIQVLQKALEVWDLQVIPLDSPIAEHAQVDPELENAFICHLQDHWFCIRKVNGEWYNFDSLYAAPQHLSKFYLSAYLDSLKTFGWSIFLVRGNFPKECPISSSEASNGYGQWLSPEDAERITKSCNSTQAPPQRINRTQHHSETSALSGEAEMISEVEDADLKAAIAASLMDSFPATASVETPATASVETPATAKVEAPATASVEAPATATAETPAAANAETPAAASAETLTPQNENQHSKEKIQ
ncbi:ataxin-3 homolog [Castanea sativa]|uniref:ataxin-3 homolog n=1 Tax=Castanea sativa TaxID=21020 RepID=UPI003F652D7E